MRASFATARCARVSAPWIERSRRTEKAAAMKKSNVRTSGNGRTRAARDEPKGRTRFVPRAVFRTAFAGVVPVCVAASDMSCARNPGGVAATGFTTGADASDTACPPSCLSVAGYSFALADAAFAAVGDTGSDAPSDADSGADALIDAPDGTSDAGQEDGGPFGDSATDGSFADAGLDGASSADAQEGSDG